MARGPWSSALPLPCRSVPQSANRASAAAAVPRHPAPRHVAIIADGNKRWATRHGLPVGAGHEAGWDAAKARVMDAIELGISELSLFTFSTENWDRPAEEVHGIMELATRRLASDTPELAEQGVHIRFLGRREELPADLVRQIQLAEQRTETNDAITLFLAFNYGGRAEILDAARRFTEGDEAVFSRCLYAPEMRDPDVMIRTGGERRLSNFMLWECAYAELVFREEMWPAFTREALEDSLAEFAARRRRFGAR